MKLHYLHLLLTVLVLQHISLSQNHWTWMHGSNNTHYLLPVYGIQGIPSPANTPGGRMGGACWMDNNNNLWLYGGLTKDPFSSSSRFMADMWKYDVNLNQWVWMSGPNTYTALPVHGTMGVSSPSNNPGGRIQMSFWKDASGNFWLYGGLNNANSANPACLADLWKYNVSNNEWTWMGGSSSFTSQVNAVYSPLGVPSSSAFPGSRSAAFASVDLSGNFWLYGGKRNYAGTLSGEVWNYNVSTNMWTWAVATGTTTYPTSYGTMGVGTASTHPGARHSGFSFSDLSGNLWIYGGNGQTDLWKFNTNNLIWTWMGGSSSGTGSYGTLGVPTYTNFPVSRYQGGGMGSLTDNNGSLILFGGNNGVNARYNDFWKFIPSTGAWIWSQGSSQPNLGGVYGTLGVSAPSNMPGARVGQYMWKDGNGKIWVYGGLGFNIFSWPVSDGYLNDLWKQNTCVNPPLPVNTSSTIFCHQNSATLTVNGSGTINWYPTAVSPISMGVGSVFVTPSLSAPTAPVQYTYYAQSTGSCGVSFVRTPVIFTVLPAPTITINSGTICQGNSITLFAGGGTTYTWSNSIHSNSLVVNPTATTVYTVIGTSTAGCSASAMGSVYVNPQPAITVNSGTICEGESFQLIPSGALSYSVTGGNLLVSPVVNSNYSVTGTSSAGCVSSFPAVANITVYPLPAISSPDGSVCPGQSFTIQASGANNYTYSSGSSVVSPTTTSTYTIIGASIHGCLNTCTMNVAVVVCVGLNEPTHSFEIRVVPNPFNESFRIDGPPGMNYRLVNMIGQVMIEGVVAEVSTIHVLPLSKGVYTLIGKWNGQTLVRRVVSGY